MIRRRAMNRGSSPAAIIAASQYSAASGSLPRRLLMNARRGVVVAVAGPVVGEHPLLGGRLDVLQARA